MAERYNLSQKLERAHELLNTVNHAAMATVNTDGSPHNTPYFFLCSPDLQYLYWGSHPESEHSKNIARTGQLFVVLYDAVEHGGLYIRADTAHIAEGEELVQALHVHNERRVRNGKNPLLRTYYEGDSPQRMWVATTRQFWTTMVERDSAGNVIRDIRVEIAREDLTDE